MWLGKDDPCETTDEVRTSDPFRSQLVAVITQWEKHLRIDNRYTVQEVIAQAVNEPNFYTALMAVASAKTGSAVSNERLGRWLKRVEGRMVGQLALRSPGTLGGYPLWSLVKA